MKMPKHTPLIVATTLSAAILLWAIASVSEDTYRLENEVPINGSFQALLSSQSTQDGDSDGLEDWEEILWKSDPQNPDTDGDQTKDGEEISLGRNPIIKGPKDTLQVTTAPTSTVENKNLTENFSHEFIALYLLQKDAGKPLDEAFQQEVLNRALSKNIPSEAKIYTTKDATVGSDISPEAMKIYGNAVGKIFNGDNLPQNAYEPLEILQKSFEKEDKNEIKKLIVLAEISRKMTADILAIKVPQTLTREHLNLVNAMSTITENFTSMGRGFEDPLKALFHAQMYYASSVTNLRGAIKSIGDYFRLHNIVFQQPNDGTIIMDTI